MSKLALHFQTLTPWAAAVVRGAFAWAKVIDPGPVDLFPGVRTIGRVWIGGDGVEAAYVRQGAAGAEAYYERCRPAYDRSPWMHCWEGPNESDVGTREARRQLAAFTVRWAERMHAGGRRVAVGSFARGTPQLKAADPASTAWADLGPMLQAADYLALHQYGPGAMDRDAPWQALRHRLVIQELRALGLRVPPILLTEFGIDAGGLGWKECCELAEYQRQSAWASGELDRDPEVQCATIFTSGANSEWTDKGFAFEEGPARWLVDFARAHPSPVQPVPQPPAPTPVPSIPRKVTAPGVTYRDWYGTPHHESRRGRGITTIVLHGSEGLKTLAWFANRASKVSAHDVVHPNGVISRCVTYDRMAWHIGTALNPETIGIEFEHAAGPELPKWGVTQIEPGIAHVRELMRVFGVPLERVLGHSDIFAASKDPRGFPWYVFREALAEREAPAVTLPEQEEGTPALLAQKARWWAEEMQRQYQVGAQARAEEIRLSLIRLLYRLEGVLRG